MAVGAHEAGPKLCIRHRFDRDSPTGAAVETGRLRLIGVEAARIYRDEYRSVIRGDEFPTYLALMVADAAVNQGPKTAVTLIQFALRATPDGIIGPQTLAHARDAPPIPTIESYAAQRAFHYGTRAGFPTFGLGWMRRLADVRIGPSW